MKAPGKRLRTVLFDLDGTLVDTAPDMAAALNRVLAENGMLPLPFEQIRPHVSHGSVALLDLALDPGNRDAHHEQMRQRFLEIYRDNLDHQSRLFPEMEDVLQTLEARGMNWGVVTNKPAWLTDPLMEGLGLTGRSACIVSGDSTPRRKPHPGPLLQACREAGSKASECVYVGDAQRDIEAGVRAGMCTLIARFGYIHAEEQPERWGADGFIDSPGEIVHWIDQHG